MFILRWHREGFGLLLSGGDHPARRFIGQRSERLIGPPSSPQTNAPHTGVPRIPVDDLEQAVEEIDIDGDAPPDARVYDTGMTVRPKSPFPREKGGRQDDCGSTIQGILREHGSRSAAGPVTNLTRSLMGLLATFLVHASWGAAIVMVQTREDGNRLDAPFAAARSRDRLLLGERLVRPGLVVETYVLGHETSQMRFAHDQHVVEELSTQRSGKPLRECVQSGAPTAVRTTRVPADSRTRQK